VLLLTGATLTEISDLKAEPQAAAEMMP